MEIISKNKIVAKPKRVGQPSRWFTPTQKTAWVADYRRSGLTMAAFARRKNLRYSTFAAWVLRAATSPAATTSPAVRFAQVAWPTAHAVDGPPGLEVSLTDGTRVRGGGVSELASLVRALLRS